MEILPNYDLTKLNTFGINAKAKFFVEIKEEGELTELFESPIFQKNPKLFLGGGSNVLLTEDFEGLVILNRVKGTEILEENTEEVVIRAMGGEIWHDLVNFVVERDYWGIENLAYIPGSVGAAPMQNIGAYGAELQNVLENVEAVEVATGAKKIFKKEECCFGYRDSAFKQEFKGKYFILAITIRLSKTEKKNISYKILKEYLEKNQIEVRSPKDIADAVTSIRKSKLPDPKVIGNAGSFFKNVFVGKEKLAALQKQYPELPYFLEGEKIKIPTAWLIEQCGPASPRHGGASWKGYREGDIGVHEKQALVLVNYGGGTGKEIKNLAEQIIDSVYSKFGLKLIPEVNVI